MFLTFETDKCVRLAQERFKDTTLKVCNYHLIFRRAQMPSDINWENMGTSFVEQYLRKSLILVILGVILFFGYRFQIKMQELNEESFNFEQMDCSIFKNSLNTQSDSNVNRIQDFTRVKYQE